jgi:hypothetical protein
MNEYDFAKLYTTSACVTGPTIDDVIISPCVNEEYFDGLVKEFIKVKNEPVKYDWKIMESDDFYDKIDNLLAKKETNEKFIYKKNNKKNIFDKLFH